MGNHVILFLLIIWGTLWWISFRKFLDKFPFGYYIRRCFVTLKHTFICTKSYVMNTKFVRMEVLDF